MLDVNAMTLYNWQTLKTQQLPKKKIIIIIIIANNVKHKLLFKLGSSLLNKCFCIYFFLI
jgi:hypothetical protein